MSGTFITNDDLENWFGYHPASTDAIAVAHQFVRQETLELARMLNALLPEGTPDKTLALRKLREAAMWANAAIACKQEIGAQPWIARATSITITPQPEPVYVNICADPEAAEALAQALGEAFGLAIKEIFGEITEEQRERLQAAVNAAIEKTASRVEEKYAEAV